MISHTIWLNLHKRDEDLATRYDSYAMMTLAIVVFLGNSSMIYSQLIKYSFKFNFFIFESSLYDGYLVLYSFAKEARAR